MDKLGEQFNIAFKVVKPRDDTNQVANITPGKKIIGSSKEDAVLIELALIDKHYILNEVVRDVTAYALKNYKQIKQDCPNKPEEWILKVSRRRGNTYEICSRDAHIKSYELVKLATSNRIPFNYEELEKLPTALYDLANTHIEDISLFDDKNFIPFVKPSEKTNKQIKQEKQEIVYTYYYADTECDVTETYHRAYWISYRKRGCNEINYFEGEDCTVDFLDALPNHSVVYFHNLAYDSRMFSNFNITNSIDKGTRTMSQSFNHCGKHIIFKDSI